MSKLFHVTLQKWQAQTSDLLETLTKFLLYFLTTYDESNHQSLIVLIQSTSPEQKPTFVPASPCEPAGLARGGGRGCGGAPLPASGGGAPPGAPPPPSPADSSPSQPRSSFRGCWQERIPLRRARPTPARLPGSRGPAALSQPAQRR